MRVFISHSSKDKPAVRVLVQSLRDRGFDPWLDEWEIAPGTDFVARINQGLDESQAGIIVFSANADASRYVQAELSYLIHARVTEEKPLVPVVLDDAVTLPPLLRTLSRRRIDDVDAIAEALRHRGTPRPNPPGEPARVNHVVITLQRQPDAAIRVAVTIDGTKHGTAEVADPPELAALQDAFSRGIRHDPRAFSANDHASQTAELARLGRALGALCFPGDSAAAIADLLDGAPLGSLVEIMFEADDPLLLGLAFEAARLPDDRVLALHDHAVTLRRPLGLAAREQPPLSGPLKILVAAAVPDEGTGGGSVLDQERELGAILDAVEPAAKLENCQVRVLEVGHPDPIGAALALDAYHVLHLSCHGLPGALQMETEDGHPINVPAEALLAPMRSSGRPLPLVLLNACQTGTPAGQTASLAQSLLKAVPAVLAMQAPVGDYYATNLARAFYRHLAAADHMLPSRALAKARRELEVARQAAVARGGAPHETQPEYATAALFVAGQEHPLADFGLDKQPLHQTPVLHLPGPVPQLSLGELIGRRREQRETLSVLRDLGRPRAGVVLTGIGGVGKSALAGRIMCRLAEEGWVVPAVRGKFSLTDIAVAIGTALRQTRRPAAEALAADLLRENLDDRERPILLARAMATEPVLLVLDDFEQNLSEDGSAFRDPDAADQLRALAEQTQRGRLLLTCRHPVPDTADLFARIAVGPLSAAETRKKLLRLPGLLGRDAREIATALRVIGGHPRMLEFLDALLRDAPARLGPVSRKLSLLAEKSGLEVGDTAASLADATRLTLQLGARDVLLEGLLEIARSSGVAEVLLQAAVSNLPVSPEGIARMLAADDAGDVAAVRLALVKLEALSLVYRFPDGRAFVHRWTAEALAGIEGPDATRERLVRAGAYRWWRVENESHALDDAVEALRNDLRAEAWDEAAGVALACLRALQRFQQSVAVAALAGEVLETLPETHAAFAAIADQEARAHLALGATGRAMARYRSLLARHEALATAQPDRADYQRDLSVSYNKMGDLFGALGQGDAARDAFAKSLAIAERLARAEPDRADYQRDLSVSYIKMGDLFRALGQGEAARDAFAKSLAISETLARAEPDRADYQRDLSVSYIKMGDLLVALGQSEAARDAFAKSLAIRETLARADPDRADYQRDLSVSYNKMGDLFGALGQGEAARDAFAKSLAIRETLARADPDRADYQRDLIVSYVKHAERDTSAAGQVWLRRALDVAEALHAGGRLQPVDAWMIDDLKQRIAAHGGSGGGKPGLHSGSGPSLLQRIAGWLRRWWARSSPGGGA